MVSKQHWFFRLAIGGLILACLIPLRSPIGAVVIRHDKNDADALRLGERFDAVGRVLPDGGCTLIAPTWVVTAAHVAASIPRDGQVQFGDSTYGVKRTILHPRGVGRKGIPPEVDLALVELSRPVEQIRPVELYRGQSELDRTVFIVGYGDYGNPRSGMNRTDGRRRAVTNIVDDAGPYRIFMTFDEPPNGSSHEGVGAAGDSGGPALLEQDGTLFLAGVSSASDGKPGQYGVRDIYTRVGSYIDWIEMTMKSK